MDRRTFVAPSHRLCAAFVPLFSLNLFLHKRPASLLSRITPPFLCRFVRVSFLLSFPKWTAVLSSLRCIVCAPLSYPWYFILISLFPFSFISQSGLPHFRRSVDFVCVPLHSSCPFNSSILPFGVRYRVDCRLRHFADFVILPLSTSWSLFSQAIQIFFVIALAFVFILFCFLA